MIDKQWKLFMFAAIMAFSSISVAQDFSQEAGISKVPNTGFYKIQLAPALVSALNDQVGDIRVYDAENKELPYLLEFERPLSQTEYFVEYRIIEKTEQTSWPYYTRIVVHNPDKNKISNIHLLIKNSDVSKSLKLSGSDDAKNWYVIKDNYRFHSMFSDRETSVIKIIDFPLSNYEFYEILIDDWKNNPVNILKAGFFNTSVEKGKYSVINGFEISQLELPEDKQSLIKISFAAPCLINKIQFKIEGPEFYHRNADIQVKDSTLDKRKKSNYFFRTVSSVTLSSNSDNIFYFDKISADHLFVRVNNHDNEPIKIIDAHIEQLNHYLVCRLDSGTEYKIRFGNPQVQSPVYDIRFFKDRIPAEIPVIHTGDIKHLTKNIDPKDSFFHLDRKIIWIAIIVVIVILLYMISRMLKEMKTDKNS
jgi:hypothetical protein